MCQLINCDCDQQALAWSPAHSSEHSYAWMYNAVEARLETMRLQTQEAERVAAYRPDASTPMTPGVEVPKGRGKGKPDRDTSKEACQRNR